MNELLRHIERDLSPLLPPASRTAFAADLRSFELQLSSLGLEVLRAEHEGVRFTAAVCDELAFPLMAKIHRGLFPLLITELPRNLLDAIRALRTYVATGGADDFRAAAFALAHPKASNPILAAALRFCLFQGARLNLTVAAFHSPEVDAALLLDRFSDEAEDTVCSHIMAFPSLADGDRPLELLVADLLRRVRPLRDKVLAEVATYAPATLERFAALTDLVGVSQALPPEDAILLRDAIFASQGAPKTQSASQRRLHPHLFPSQNAVDQRRRRLPATIARHRRAQTLQQPTPTRLIDALTEEQL